MLGGSEESSPASSDRPPASLTTASRLKRANTPDDGNSHDGPGQPVRHGEHSFTPPLVPQQLASCRPDPLQFLGGRLKPEQEVTRSRRNRRGLPGRERSRRLTFYPVRHGRVSLLSPGAELGQLLPKTFHFPVQGFRAPRLLPHSPDRRPSPSPPVALPDSWQYGRQASWPRP